MEIRFDRDLRHNYMVLCGLKTGEDYRLRMLAENSPQGLLKCSLRNINGGGYLYYEIDSKQQFGNRFADGRLRAEDMKRFLRSVIRLTEGLEDYLLDIERVLFSTDCIYVDIRTGDFYFVYCPFTEESEEALQKTGAFSVFSEDLLSCLDPDDEEAARIASWRNTDSAITIRRNLLKTEEKDLDQLVCHLDSHLWGKEMVHLFLIS